ncbi:MAG: Branched-chain amino acid transport system / permease component [Firmicutes bacterium ADurb.Bin182]|nr:MAG: Branched-chain amino acid transport system / permease component [Firmicutes bacterium ADurb.Bin182]
MNGSRNGNFNLKNKIIENMVPIIFVAFTLLGFAVSSGVPLSYFLSELSSRFFRNAFLVLSLVIPVIAGLGLNFGIVVGAISGQIAIAIVRYFYLEGLTGLLLCFAIAAPIAAFFGWLTGKLYNKTRGQEMIASLIVSFFANGIYQFLFLFVVGVIILVPATHPMIKPDGVGIRMSVDMGKLKYALESILEVPFMWAVLVVCVAALVFMLLRHFKKKQELTKNKKINFYIRIGVFSVLAVISIISIITGNSLMSVRDVPAATAVLIALLCLFTSWIMKTKLGQDFRSVGQNQYIAGTNGIDVDKTRIIAVIMSTVFASWGQIIYLQNMGTLNTYGAHNQIGMFSVAAILVGGASVSKATVGQALLGTILFNSMFIMSPEIGKALFGQAILGEYFRTFMVYGIIGMALGLYVWKANRASKLTIDPDALSESTGRSAWITIPTPPDSSSSSGTRTN